MTMIYLAPLEGLTPYTYRAVFQRHFDGVDKFFTPFITATHTHSFQGRERREFETYQENTVPQLMAKDAETFLPSFYLVAERGYREINLNMGCPAPTAYTKGRGSGMLEDPDKLDRFFEEVFSDILNHQGEATKLSVKTRIGVKDPAEVNRLAEVLARYPFSEVIVHPRVRVQGYGGETNMEAFKTLYNALKVPVCFNGDIVSVNDAERILTAFPGLSRIMIGRGLLADPSLARTIKGGQRMSREELISFMDDLWISYEKVLSGERDMLFKMIDLWTYLGWNFPEHEKELKKIRKSKSAEEYLSISSHVLEKYDS